MKILCLTKQLDATNLAHHSFSLNPYLPTTSCIEVVPFPELDKVDCCSQGYFCTFVFFVFIRQQFVSIRKRK